MWEKVKSFVALFAEWWNRDNLIDQIDRKQKALLRAVASQSILFDRLKELEQTEQGMIEEGLRQPTLSAKRRIAAQLSQLRSDICQVQNRQALYGVSVITLRQEVANLTIRNDRVSMGLGVLPTNEQLAEGAVEVQQIFEEATDTVDFVNSLASQQLRIIPPGEASILKELGWVPTVAPVIAPDIEQSFGETLEQPQKSAKAPA